MRSSLPPFPAKLVLARVHKQLVRFCVLCAFSSTLSTAQTVMTMVNFGGSNGSYPEFVSLVQGRDGYLWGTTSTGGANNSCYQGCGTIFRVTPAGPFETVYSFDGSSGFFPNVGLTLGVDGNLYGAASGGTCGTLFQVTPAGAVSFFFNFNCSDGWAPGALTQGTDGMFYGTTTSDTDMGHGTIFKVSAAGVLTTLHYFDLTDGACPCGQLLEGPGGDFYGTTEGGGQYNLGTVFRISSTGTFTLLYSFSITASDPWAGLVQGYDGGFYGTTEYASNGYGSVFRSLRQERCVFSTS